MKIANLTTFVMGSVWRNLTFLKLTTDEGLTGVSTGRPASRRSHRHFSVPVSAGSPAPLPG